MRIAIYANENAYDITQFTSNYDLSGDIDSSSRILTFDLLSNKLDLDVELGSAILFTDNDLNVWYKGYIFTKDISEKEVYSIKCYDSMFWLNNNKDIFLFSNKTIGEVMTEIGTRFGVKIKISDDSTYKLSSLPVDDRTAYDFFRIAEKQVYQHTGERFGLRSNTDGDVELFKRKNKVHEWLIQEGNLISYSYSEDASNLKTKIKLTKNYKKKSNIIATATANNELISKFGILQESKNVTEKTNQAQMNERANKELSQLSRIEKKLSVECLGQNGVYAGDSIFLNIPKLGISKAYYIKKDSHSYKGNQHTMSLELTELLEFE